MATNMIDTIHDNVDNIPVSAPKVAGYTTGTPAVQWTARDWSRFNPSVTGLVRIDQGYTWPAAPSSYGALDVENLAVTVADVPGAQPGREFPGQLLG